MSSFKNRSSFVKEGKGRIHSKKKSLEFSKPWSGPCPPPPPKSLERPSKFIFFSNDLKIFSAEENKRKGLKLAKKELRSIGMMVDRLNGP